MSRIRFAGLGDVQHLMAFMHEHWRADHILSRNRELFLYDFQDGERLNMAIAEDERGEIIGLFGFMKYNSRPTPDIAGSLWKVVEGAGEPMLGLRLRRFVIEQIPHRYFAAPGAGLQTRPIYRLLDMHWVEMEQYFRINAQSPTRQLCLIEEGHTPSALRAWPGGYAMEEISDPAQLTDYSFDEFDHLGPSKDQAYVERRFFRHPINDYRVFLARRHGSPVAIAVCREVYHAGASALRIVDYYGDERHMPALIAHLDGVMHAENHEYLDFICCGFSPQIMSEAGLRRLDFDSQYTVVPNYFEPFVRSNVRVYAVADRNPAISPRLCKADGDQDRPNFERDMQRDSGKPRRQANGR